MSFSVLIVDDEKSFRVIAEAALAREGYAVRTADCAAAGARAWRQDPADVVLLDRNLPDADGVELLATLSHEAQERGVDTIFLVCTAYADVENAVQALRQGADDYLTKPIQLSEMVVKIRKALEARRLRNRVRALRHEGPSPMDALLASASPAMREAVDRARKVAKSPSTSVLLQGESGTGKEVVARLIHEETPGRKDEALVALNCAAIAEGLLESELFGHERGAFTDAKAGKPGLLELAAGGTLFLDEIGELPPSLQTKLLRALETTTFRRVGGTRDLVADVRIIAATNRNLEEEVAAGRFRLDLFHRLDVFRLTLPPLRERREDIPALSRWLLDRIAQRLVRPSPQLSPEALQVLQRYDYPGNVRELRNVLERALILESGPQITPASLVLGKLARAPAEAGASAEAAFFSVGLREDGRPPTLSQLERLYVEKLLAHAEGNRAQVARLLDVSYPTVAKKIADYGIKLPE
ncbi:MAG TPA: sigma-54 dependent transcriptional regulator [Myxococcales bacterium]|jgi:two-component system, NtrC family, response regulator AtoC|nr:sigma-54 dependent transcriptional regulator [Myxococcales bacterium]